MGPQILFDKQDLMNTCPKKSKWLVDLRPNTTDNIIIYRAYISKYMDKKKQDCAV